MLDLCRIIFGIVLDLVRPRAALEAEILVLRQQIIVLRRGRCPFRKYDREWIRVVRQNHHIIRIDVCDPAWARNVRR
jgi:hypothetical protein